MTGALGADGDAHDLQNVQRLPDGVAADVQRLGQGPFRRQPGSDGQMPQTDLLFEIISGNKALAQKHTKIDVELLNPGMALPL